MSRDKSDKSASHQLTTHILAENHFQAFVVHFQSPAVAGGNLCVLELPGEAIDAHSIYCVELASDVFEQPIFAQTYHLIG